MPASPSTRLARLKALAATPDAQSAYALELLPKERNRQVLEAALKALEGRYLPAARPALLARYAEWSADGVRHDPGAYLRASALRSLRPVALQDDVALLETALTTYEFLPPGRMESCAGLRAAALVVLNELAETRAGYHAVRLLEDEHTARMSGEPALTAARALAAQGQVLPLYYYALYARAPAGEVLSECLKALTGLPVALVPALFARYATADDELVLAGLCDLALGHEHAATFSTHVLAILHTTRRPRLYHYVAAAMVASRKPEPIAALLDFAREEQDPVRVKILLDVLPLARGHAGLERVLKALRQRVR